MVMSFSMQHIKDFYVRVFFIFVFTLGNANGAMRVFSPHFKITRCCDNVYVYNNSFSNTQCRAHVKCMWKFDILLAIDNENRSLMRRQAHIWIYYKTLNFFFSNLIMFTIWFASRMRIKQREYMRYKRLN